MATSSISTDQPTLKATALGLGHTDADTLRGVSEQPREAQIIIADAGTRKKNLPPRLADLRYNQVVQASAPEENGIGATLGNNGGTLVIDGQLVGLVGAGHVRNTEHCPTST